MLSVCRSAFSRGLESFEYALIERDDVMHGKGTRATEDRSGGKAEPSEKMVKYPYEKWEGLRWARP